MGCHIYLYNKYRHEKKVPWIRIPGVYYDRVLNKEEFKAVIEELVVKGFSCVLLEYFPDTKTVGEAINKGLLKSMEKLNNRNSTACCTYPCWERDYDRDQLMSIYNKMLDTDKIRCC